MRCPVCSDDDLRVIPGAEIHCDNCDTTWGITYIDGSPVGRGKQAYRKIRIWRKLWLDKEEDEAS